MTIKIKIVGFDGLKRVLDLQQEQAGPARFYINFAMMQPVQRVGMEEAVLGLESLATIPELRRAYRRLAKANHPDLGPEGEREARTKRMAELNVAYKVALQRRGH